MTWTSKPDLIPEIRARLAAEQGCRESDLNIKSVYEQVTETRVVRAAEPMVPRYNGEA